MTKKTAIFEPSPLQPRVGAVMVVGGGIGGIEASLSLADSGYKVYLVENSPSIGGTMARLDKTFPTNDCSMCILSPKLVECGRHLNIESMTCSEVVSLSGEAGDFTVRVKSRSRFVDPAKCTGCGDCAAACPVEWTDEFNAGLGKRKAIYRPFPQAYPNVFSIDKRVRGNCATACPGGINIQGFVALIGAKKYREALGLIRESMAFPSVCGRVCHHPCEDVCKRGEYDGSLSVMALKRFVADKCGEEELHLPPKAPGRPQRVAVIGGGPAGLSAAFELAKKGYPVEVFEALPEAGGMLAVGIPEYRLPRDVLRREIGRIEKMGVKIHTGKRLGRDMTMESLKKDGFAAILLAIGAHAPLKLGIPGEDLPGVIDCVKFLRDVNLGNKVVVGPKVVVVGGGNAAIDSARVARRLGDCDVTIVYRRTRKEMPANPEEISEALNEGIKIEYLAAPVEVKAKDGRAASLVCRRMKLGPPDASGRRSPVPVEGSGFEIPVDTLIPAISQKVEMDFAPGMKQTRWGSIETAAGSSATGVDGVFACGDAVLGPSTVIDCIAAGKKSAEDIHAALSGEPRKEAPKSCATGKCDARKVDFPGFVDRSKRAEIPRVEIHSRINNFNEVEHALSEQEAVEEARRCLACGVCCECMQCVAVCKAGAVSHAMEDKFTDVKVGAIVLAPGFREFDASRKFNLGYSRSDNIVSGMEFERILSASGPFGGHVSRPSDHGPVKKVAFIQCVGSRDKQCGNEYCSSVCCMYAIKEAVIAREHDRNVSPTIFYMDIRAHGKDFDKYVDRARDEYGIVFKRSRVFSVEEEADGKVWVSFENEEGRFEREQFDLGVLAVGLEPGAEFPELARRLGVERNCDGFFKTDPRSPLDTTRPGIFVCGAASGPRDIPETVVQAGGAAARAGMLLGTARGTLTRAKTYPAELDVAWQGPRIGVFVCHCGINIGGVVRVPSVVEYARSLPNVVYAEENLYTCSQDTQDKIKALIREKGLNRVVVASCSPRTHEPLFQETIKEAGLNPHLFEMANIRDQCSWVHMADKDGATAKAADLVRMAVAKVRDAVPLRTMRLPVNHAGLVLGGGLSGMTAALALADQGFEVFLVEREKELGGNMRRLDRDISGRKTGDHLKALASSIRRHPRIRLFTGAVLREVSGFLGNFESTISVPGPRGKGRAELKLKHGAAVIAVGGRESRPAEFGYGRSRRVVTQMELEEMFKARKFKARRVVMIQCAGSRDAGHPYCSRLCCTQAVKNAIRIKEEHPDAEVVVLYRDIRTHGAREHAYAKARGLGVQFARFTADSKPRVAFRGPKLTVGVRDTLSGADLRIPADLVVLASRIDPEPDMERLAPMFKVPLNAERFFLEAHVKLRPVDFATEGLFVCGLAHYPKDMSECAAQALAAAGKAAAVLGRETIEAEARVSSVRAERCSGCGACVTVCAYKAIELDPEKGIAVVNEGVCKGCGACAATCRAAAIDLRGFRDDQILQVLHAV